MITLATLSQATPQAVFEQSARHLLTQNCRSANSEMCLYRGQNNTKCAAGIFISDEEAHNTPEVGWNALVLCGKAPPDHANLIKDLQQLHDRVQVSLWRIELVVLARKHSLNWDFINTEFPIHENTSI